MTQANLTGRIYIAREAHNLTNCPQSITVSFHQKNIKRSLTMATTPSISQSQKLDQVAETGNRDELHGSHTGTRICVHSLPPGNMQMQPLHFLQYCGSCHRALGPEADITFTSRFLGFGLVIRDLLSYLYSVSHS